MKKIILHGLLKKMFCDSFVVKANSLKDIFKCVASNTTDYSFKMNEVLKQNCGLALVIDGVLHHDVEIDLDSCIKSASVVEIFICSGLNFVVLPTVVGYLAALTWISVLKFVLFVAIMVGISYLITYLMKPGDPKQIKTASFIFSGRDNVAARNTPIQLGYGRLRVGSSVINAIPFSFDSSYISAINNVLKTEVGVGNYSSKI